MKNNNWKDCTLTEFVTLKDAIKNLNATGKQICLITTDNNQLVGVITDGDVRKAFIDGISLETSIATILNRNPVVCSHPESETSILQLMSKHKIRHIPIIDNSKKLIGLYSLDQKYIEHSELDTYFLIMAGGFGKRLHPLTNDCPKPMLKIAGKPILELIITKAISEGFKKFIITTHYLKEQIIEHFGNGDKWGVNIEYINEETPLGTAGALTLIKNMPHSTILVTNGDVLTDIDYSEILRFHKKYQADATMAIQAYELQNPFGVVHLNQLEIVGFEEKPIYRSHINAGIYVLETKTIQLLPQNQYSDMPTLFQKIKSHKLKAIGFPIHEPWLDVGRSIDLDKARENFKD